MDHGEDIESRLQILEAESRVKKTENNNDDTQVIRLERQIRDLSDEFRHALRQVRSVETEIKRDMAD